MALPIEYGDSVIQIVSHGGYLIVLTKYGSLYRLDYYQNGELMIYKII